MPVRTNASIVVIVLNWNGERFLKHCLDSVIQQTVECDIVVVDNGSVDNSRGVIESYGKKVVPLYNQHNLGFSGGINTGIRYALGQSYEYIVLLNNDATAEKDWLEHLLKTASSRSADIVTGKIIQPETNTIDSTGDQYSIWGLPFPRGRGETNTKKYDTVQKITAASAGASLYKNSVFKRIGLFDERFFLYFEDVDVSLRAQLAGFSLFYAPQAVVYHEIGGSSRKIPRRVLFHTTKNLNMLYLKNMPFRLFWQYLALFYISWLSRLVASLKHKWLHIWLWAQLYTLIFLPILLVQRISIQGGKVMKTSQFDQMLYKKVPPTEKSMSKILALFGIR